MIIIRNLYFLALSIKVLKKFDNDEGRYLVCGTNAFKPECREYVDDHGIYLMTKKSKGVNVIIFLLT